MSAIDKRVERLELEAAARNPSERRNIRLIAAKDDETPEQAVTRWKAEHPGEVIPEERPGFIDFIVLVGRWPIGAAP
jgi:hypothetical protein